MSVTGLRPRAALCLSACLLAWAVPPETKAAPSAIKVLRIGTQPSIKGAADWFTGTVRVDPLFPAQDPSRVSAATVTFEPGARTAWHTHPLGQTLIVIAGCGRVQSWGGPVEEIRPGDVVRIPPDVKHWHGAAPTTAMTHIAIQEQSQGRTVDWLEKVSDAQYLGMRCVQPNQVPTPGQGGCDRQPGDQGGTAAL
ncbi:MAG: cupin domain-containing protein [Acidobacteria bacterium]|nr:cupin domain-containing protein [Acidobacteriota bacterium]MBI3489477.1 cupin domain-containing protein [Acidobacteriota bacterium]